jgi:hypothetical protein
MSDSRLYDWEGIATMGRQNPETRWVESALVLYLCVLAISNRFLKDSSSDHNELGPPQYLKIRKDGTRKNKSVLTVGRSE